MLIQVLYALNIILLSTGLFGVYLKTREQRFSLALIQILFGLPFLAGQYFYLTYHLEERLQLVVIFSEVIIAFIWLIMALRLRRATLVAAEETRFVFPLEMIGGLLLITVAGYYCIYRAEINLTGAIVHFDMYSPVYFASIFTLTILLYVSWRLEQFWSSLNPAQRWEYKFLIIGNMIIGGTFIWMASYRLTYLTIVPRHLLLAAPLISFGWLIMLYAVLNHQLLNRKIFVSRKIVYSFAIPSFLAVYFMSFGLISLIMRTYGLEMSFIIHWLLLILGCVTALILAFSGKIRRQIQFYISTHFYVNKYEYRDEWLALSQHLQGTQTEDDVIKALRRVLADSLYTTQIFIWVDDSTTGYRLASTPENPYGSVKQHTLAVDAGLLDFMQSHSHFYLKENDPNPEWHKVKKTAEPFLTSLNLRLITPISVDSQLVGLIGLGPEYTGGQYGHDDFDLLTVLGSQTATALLAVRMAEELAHAREQQAWNRLSAFVLHDIKNAATMLSMLQENAADHIHEPEFQQDMLELVDDALRRMSRVEQRLLTLKDDIDPTLQEIELCSTLQFFARQLQTKLAGMKISVTCKHNLQIHTDPALLFSIMENLLLNAFQAQASDNEVQIDAGQDKNNNLAQIRITDNGPGITGDLLPDLLFEPFKTSKTGGSGIGLWQVKRMITSLGGTISARNSTAGGAQFVITIPLVPELGGGNGDG